jgi:Kef-type K+ transport system membrane component KefB
MEHNLFLQISTLLAITVLIAFIIRFLKQPLLVSYMIAGIVCGPLFFNLLNSQANLYQAFSSFGVVLLLFIVGLELNLSYLKKIGKTSLIIGVIQFIFNFALVFVVSIYFLNLSLLGSLFLSLAACFSSTIVILKLLNDKRDDESVYGRYTIGLMLIQDLISIIILFCLSVFGSGDASKLNIDSLVKILLVALLILLSYKFVLPKILDKIASSGEFLFIFTVSWCFGVASLMVWSGLSLELGAILAGLSLGTSRYQPEIISRIKPLRDFFIMIFFIILGSLADFSDIKSVLLPALSLALVVTVLKPIILYIIFRSQSFTRRNSLLPALTAVPLSEFGFIILLAASNAGYLSGRELSIFTIATLITIFVSSYLISFNSKIYNLFLPIFSYLGPDKSIQKEDTKESFEAMVFGYHRTGWKIGNALKDIGISFAAVDFNPENFTRLNDHNIKAFFGDAADVEFLKALPLDKTKIIISTVHSPEDQLVLLNYLKSKKKKRTIICTLYNKKYLDKLYEAGADYVMLPHLLSGTWMAGLISKGGLSHKRLLQKLRKVQVHELKGSLDHHTIHKIVNFS